jgi:hypothetical protein
MDRARDHPNRNRVVDAPGRELGLTECMLCYNVNMSMKCVHHKPHVHAVVSDRGS